MRRVAEASIGSRNGSIGTRQKRPVRPPCPVFAHPVMLRYALYCCKAQRMPPQRFIKQSHTEQLPIYEPSGREFESLRARHKIKGLQGFRSVALFNSDTFPTRSFL